MKRSIVPFSGGAMKNRKSSLGGGRGGGNGSGGGPFGPPKPEKPTLIGHDMASEELFGFTPKHRQNHTHILGSTGTGKSKFMELLLRQDVQNRRCGVCLIDPHGKLYQDILTYIATEKPTLAERVVLFNPFNDLDNVIGFNPLPSREKDRFDYIEKNFVSACLKAWGQEDISDTPRIARWLQNIAHTLLVNDMTLLESAALITTEKHDHHRNTLVQNVVDSVVRLDWDGVVEGNQQKRSELVEGAGNRLMPFLKNEIIRLIIGQKDNVLDLPQIMDEGKILLVNLNDQHGRVTPPDSKLLGTLLVSELYRVARLRDPYDPRLKPFYIYIDEFAQFVSNDIAYSLEEVRKFKVFYLLAHQHLGQLKRENAYLYQSVLTNCKNKVVFGGLSSEDAEIMTKEVQEGFVDLKEIKHTQTRIRERHIETTRRVRQEQFSQTTGQSNQRSSSTTQSESDAVGQSLGETRSQSHTESASQGTTSSQSHGKTRGTSDTSTRSTGRTSTTGQSSSVTDSTGRSDGQSQSLNFNRSDTEGSSQGKSNSYAHASGESRSVTHGGSRSEGRSMSETHSQGNTESSGSSYMNTESTGNFASSGENRTMRAGEYDYASRGYNEGSGASRNVGYSDGGSSSSSQNETWAQQQGRSRTDTENWSETSGDSDTHTTSRGSNESQNQSHTRGSGEAFGKSSSTNQSRAQTRGQNSSEGRTVTDSVGRSTNQSETHTTGSGTSESRGTADTEGFAQSRQRSETHTTGTAETEGQAHTDSRSESRGYSVGDVPFFEIEEVEEVASVQFWSLNDLMYMKRAEMRNLDVAQAFVKIENQPPVHCRVAHMPDPRVSRYLANDMVEDLKLDVVDIHKGQYLPLRQAKRRIIQRQEEAFGEHNYIRFYDTLPSDPPRPDDGGDNLIDDEDTPFGR